MQKVKWIKITTDIFDDEKIRLIEAIPDSDSIIVIWFKLLALAGKSNNGGLVLISDKVPYTIDMLTTLFRKKKLVIELALKTFQMYGMIEILDNDTILISNWEKHQNVKGLDNIREQNRIRQQKHRDNKKLLLLESKEIESKELDKDIDIDKESHVTNNVTKKKRFTKPTIIDINNYCKEKSITIDAEYFIDYYDSNGWKVGRNPMKDWKATVRNWSKRNTNDKPKTINDGRYGEH